MPVGGDLLTLLGRANLLLAELVGAALHHRAAVRVTPANQGKTWARLMEAEGPDFATVEALAEMSERQPVVLQPEVRVS